MTEPAAANAPAPHSAQVLETEIDAVIALCGGDIALLAPTGTELWRYERALEEAGLPFISQAGKNLFRRQEAQDLVALIRALADPRDTIALGALLRGPVVGLTEQELLDIAGSLPAQENGGDLTYLSLRTDPALVPHPVARQTLTILRDLRRRVQSTAPSLLIAEAVERLKLRAILVARSADQASRALANVDAILERARAYGVRGFRQFARDLGTDWSRRASHAEGVVDAEGQAIEIVTIHSSKGLEWPVVIPINTVSGTRPPEQFVHRRSDDTLHWVLGDIVSPSLAEAMAAESEQESQQRLRLLYVACTRAMELLVLPALSWPGPMMQHGRARLISSFRRCLSWILPDSPKSHTSGPQNARTCKRRRCLKPSGPGSRKPFRLSAGFGPATAIRTLFNSKPRQRSHGSNRSNQHHQSGAVPCAALSFTS